MDNECIVECLVQPHNTKRNDTENDENRNEQIPGLQLFWFDKSGYLTKSLVVFDCRSIELINVFAFLYLRCRGLNVIDIQIVAIWEGR